MMYQSDKDRCASDISIHKELLIDILNEYNCEIIKDNKRGKLQTKFCAKKDSFKVKGLALLLTLYTY